MNTKIRQTLPVLLSILGSVGVVATSILVAKKTPEAATKLEELKKDNEEIKTIDIAKEVIPIYLPAIITGLATIASISSSTILSKKTEASLAATAMMIDQGYRKYKNEIKSKFGLDKHSDILDSIVKKEKKPKIEIKNNNEKLYYEEHLGYFTANPEKLALAYSDLNQRLQIEDYGKTSYYCMLYNLVEDSELKLEDPKKVTNRDLQWGWSSEYLNEIYGYSWVHMFYYDKKLENGTEYTQIIFEEDPILDPGNHGEDFVDKNDSKDVPWHLGKFRSVGALDYAKN